MRVLGFDTETTGLDTKKARIIEVGATLFDVMGNWKPIESYGSLVYELGDDALAPETTKITGITQEELERDGKPRGQVISSLAELAQKAEMVVCHNAEYDKAMLWETVKKYNFDITIPAIGYMLGLPWICSVMDLRSNREYKCRTLSHLALDRGVAVDPADLHRAVGDVALMGKMLSTAKDSDPKEMYAYQQSPWVFLQAIIPPPWEDGGKGKDAATKLGYSWEKARHTDGPVFSKTWVKRVKDCDVEDEKKSASFPVKIIQC